MKRFTTITLLFVLLLSLFGVAENVQAQDAIKLSAVAKQVLAGKQILYVERHQYAGDHHNTATLFQVGEINTNKFAPGGAIKVYDVDSGTTRTLIKLSTGVMRDPEISFDGKRVIFSMRKNLED